jgi:GT2 family glycosyltransferase
VGTPENETVTIAAVVTAYNRADFVRKCIQSLLDSEEDGLRIAIVLVDNGSTDGTADAGMALSPDIQLIRKDENMPYPGVLNEGLEAALAKGTDYVVLMNDDTAMLPGALKRLVQACAEAPPSLLTPLQLNYREPEHIDEWTLGTMKDVPALIEDAVMQRPLKLMYEVPSFVGAGMFAKRESFEHIGLFDTLFHFYGIDDDYCNRAHFLGYRLMLVPGAHMYHAHGRISDKRVVDKAAWWWRWRSMLHARLMFILKDPDYPLWRNYVRAAAASISEAVGSIAKRFPRGAVSTVHVYAQMLARFGAIRAAYRRDFDTSQRLDTGA